MNDEVQIRRIDLERLSESLSQVLAQGVVMVDLLQRVLGRVGSDARSEDPALPARWRQRALRIGARSRTRPRYSREVYRAMRYLDAHYEEVINLDRLADVAGCSRAFLARAFRRETGETVHNWLMHVRLTQAACEVQAGDKVEAVMLGVGYRSKANFYRQFKARFGATPAEYRSQDGIMTFADEEASDEESAPDAKEEPPVEQAQEETTRSRDGDDSGSKFP
jgi:AraC-like DNA-binding protein